jgi:DNA (cytosine-5)-methyltransferase 1
MRPRLLDLFCGAGGSAVGYDRAGFDVTGVDIRPQPRFPFAFVQADALAYLAAHGHEFDAIHASPPCQAFSPLRALHPAKVAEWPDVVAPTRAGLIASGRPWVMENVVQAPFQHGVTLCGTMFSLRTYRHRRFETSFLIFDPPHPPHTVKVAWRKVRDGYDNGAFVSVTGNRGQYVSSRALGIDWMTGDELSQAIPPAYTEWVGRFLLAAVRAQTPDRNAAS